MTNRHTQFFVNRKTLAALPLTILLAACGGGGGSSSTPVLSLFTGNIGETAKTDSKGIYASFNEQYGVAADDNGNTYVADSENNAIRKIAPDGTVSTFAGSGTIGHADGTGTAASFDSLSAITIDGNGNIYVSQETGVIRKITQAGVVTTLAGIDSANYGYADGTGAAAKFNRPQGLATDPAGNVFVADSNNNVVRMITPAGVVTTVAGIAGQGDFVPGALPGHLAYPTGLAWRNGTLYVSTLQAIVTITNLP